MLSTRGLNADAVGNAADREGLAAGAVAAGDDGALKGLQALAVALDDLDLDADGVADGELGNVGTELLHFDGADDLVHCCFSFPV